MMNTSIYNIGGGGGRGYENGGKLADGGFIKVENNALSSYDNVSRNDVNFYFEPAEDEILNSVVEFTTAVNATVNVYVLRNGFYYLLDYIGGNTVNAGEEYKIDIIGNSYLIENVINNSSSPEYAVILGDIYPVKEYNGVLWTTKNLKSLTGYGTIRNAPFGDSSYNPFYYESTFLLDKLNSFYPWRVPTDDDYTKLKIYNGFVSPDGGNKAFITGIPQLPNATNSSGFTAYPYGHYNPFSVSFYSEGTEANFMAFDENQFYNVSVQEAALIITPQSTVYAAIRLCIDL